MRRLVALAVVAGVLVGGACTDDRERPGSAATGLDPFVASGSGSTASDAGPSTAPALLAVGDCFDLDGFAPGAPIDRNGIHLVPCDGPHQHEVYAIEHDPDPTGAPFPGDAAMTSLSQDRCLAAFAPAIGQDFLQSSLDFAAIVPDRPSWDAGDRAIICAVHSIDFAPLTRSVRQSLASESG